MQLSAGVTMLSMRLQRGRLFHNQKWEDEWIDEGEHLVREEYAVKYEMVAEELTEELNNMPKKNLSTKQ